MATIVVRRAAAAVPDQGPGRSSGRKATRLLRGAAQVPGRCRSAPRVCRPMATAAVRKVHAVVSRRSTTPTGAAATRPTSASDAARIADGGSRWTYNGEHLAPPRSTAKSPYAASTGPVRRVRGREPRVLMRSSAAWR
jgi:hypothetical protein